MDKGAPVPGRATAASQSDPAVPSIAGIPSALQKKMLGDLTGLDFDKRFRVATAWIAVNKSSIEFAAKMLTDARNNMAEAVKLLDELLTEVELTVADPFAQGMDTEGEDDLSASPGSHPPDPKGDAPNDTRKVRHD